MTTASADATAPAASGFKLPLWSKGDWAAYFGLLVNNLTNLLTMISLLIFVVGMPKEMVLGRIAPAFGLAIFLASVCYTWFGVKMSRDSGRTDVTVLPSGPSAPSIFTVTFLVLLPVYQTTQNAEFALSIGLVWCTLEAAILIIGSFAGDTLRRIIPRSVLLACLGGLGLLLLAMNPMLQSFHTPQVAIVVLVLIIINWFGKKPLFKKIPTGLLLLLVGTGLAWAFGLMSPGAITDALASAGFSPPSLHVANWWAGLPMALPYLASAVPLGLANYVFDLENIESAHAAGDPYHTRNVMLANGFSSLAGAGLGNPFPVTVYIGHVGWKSLGARLGYSFASGFTMLIIGLFGLSSLLLSIVPMAAVAPILIYIGIVSANQAVRETSKEEIPIFFIALFPWIANWATTLVGNTLKAAGTTAGEVGADKLQSAGVDWLGLTGLGNGAPLLSILLGCIAIFAIRNQTLNAALVAVVSAVMVFFGIIHTAHVGILQPGSVPFLLAYGMVAAIFLLKWFLERNEPATVEPAPTPAEVESATAAEADVVTHEDVTIESKS